MPNDVSFPTEITVPRFFLMALPSEEDRQFGNLDISHSFLIIEILSLRWKKFMRQDGSQKKLL